MKHLSAFMIVDFSILVYMTMKFLAGVLCICTRPRTLLYSENNEYLSCNFVNWFCFRSFGFDIFDGNSLILVDFYLNSSIF